jgi:hypothetical protein
MTDRGKYMDALTSLSNLLTNARNLSETEWYEVGHELEKLRDRAIDRSRPTPPQPRPGIAGVPICTANCTLFSAYGPEGLGCGRCLSGDGHPARTGTPCLPSTEDIINNQPKETP